MSIEIAISPSPALHKFARTDDTDNSKVDEARERFHSLLSSSIYHRPHRTFKAGITTQQGKAVTKLESKPLKNLPDLPIELFVEVGSPSIAPTLIYWRSDGDLNHSRSHKIFYQETFLAYHEYVVIYDALRCPSKLAGYGLRASLVAAYHRVPKTWVNRDIVHWHTKATATYSISNSDRGSSLISRVGLRCQMRETKLALRNKGQIMRVLLSWEVNPSAFFLSTTLKIPLT